jgi:hypothetical protein
MCGCKSDGQQGPRPQFREGSQSIQSSNRLRETINPVTGLIQQARKCHMVRVAAYIFRRSWAGRGVR